MHKNFNPIAIRDIDINTSLDIRNRHILLDIVERDITLLCTDLIRLQANSIENKILHTSYAQNCIPP